MTFARVAPPRSPFRLGDVIQAAFDATLANFPVFVLLALVLYSAPILVVTAAFGPPATRIGQPALVLGAGLASSIVSLASSALLQGALMRGVVSHLNGVKPTFGACLRAGLTAAAPLVAIGLLAGIGIVAGFVFLIVPGVFLLVLWSVAAPAQVVERVGVFRALGRSAELTAGHRWSVLGVLLVMGVLTLVIVFVGSAVGGLMIGMLSIASGGLAGIGFIWGMFLLQSVIAALAGGVAAVFSSATPAALYYGLRRAKEGSAPASLAAVFD